MKSMSVNRQQKQQQRTAISSKSTISDGARKLQDLIHELISRLSATSEHVMAWPEASGDDPSVHVERTSQLIAHVRSVVDTLQRLELTLTQDAALKQSYHRCLIPLDLLDLLDFNLNPDCFCRGLLREAMGQLAGLKRRKRALALLGAAVEAGLQERKTALAAAVVVAAPPQPQPQPPPLSSQAGVSVVAAQPQPQPPLSSPAGAYSSSADGNNGGSNNNNNNTNNSSSNTVSGRKHARDE